MATRKTVKTTETQKAATRKTAAKKAKAAPKVEKTEKAANPAAKKASRAAKKPVAHGQLYLSKEAFQAMMDGFIAQGLNREDALLTFRVGIRQANGRPVPQELLMQCVGNPAVAYDQQPQPA